MTVSKVQGRTLQPAAVHVPSPVFFPPSGQLCAAHCRKLWCINVHTILEFYCIPPYFFYNFQKKIVIPYTSLLHCHTVTLSHCYTVTLSHCHTFTLSHCYTVTLTFSHCHTATLSHFHTVTLSHCHTFTQSHIHTFTLSHCHAFTLSHFHTVTLSRSLSHCHTFTLSRFHTFTLSRFHTVTHIYTSIKASCFISQYITVSSFVNDEISFLLAVVNIHESS